MSADLKLFVEEILGVNPQYKNFNIFAPGSNLPGMGGQAIATTGAANAGTDTTHHLQQAVVEFAQAYNRDGILLEQLEKQAQTIQGLLMMEQTLSMLSEQKVDHLLQVLHTLMEAKRGT
ncbi:MAG TPA: hypothetical protein VF401_02155 [Candidatus Saccharimonadales bacterium]